MACRGTVGLFANFVALKRAEVSPYKGLLKYLEDRAVTIQKLGDRSQALTDAVLGVVLEPEQQLFHHVAIG